MVVGGNHLTWLGDLILYRDGKDLPDPPPLPPYDPQKEAPMWSMSRVWFSLPIENSDWTGVGDKPKSDDKPDWRGVIKNNVIPLPIPEPYNCARPSPEKYFWFDTPDYADPFKKLWFAAKFFGYVGLFATNSYGVLFEGGFWAMHRKIFVPFFLGGMAGSLGLLTIANLRGKDDRWNYVGGACVASLVWGRKTYVRYCFANLLSIIAAVTGKYIAETNGYMYPEMDFNYKRTTVGGLDHKHGWSSGDWRLVKTHWGDPGRNVRTTAPGY